MVNAFSENCFVMWIVSIETLQHTGITCTNGIDIQVCIMEDWDPCDDYEEQRRGGGGGEGWNSQHGTEYRYIIRKGFRGQQFSFPHGRFRASLEAQLLRAHARSNLG